MGRLTVTGIVDTFRRRYGVPPKRQRWGAIDVIGERSPQDNWRRRPRFSPRIEPLPLRLPSGASLGSVIAVAHGADGELYVLDHGAVGPNGETIGFARQVVCFDADGSFVGAWGGDAHVPAVDGISQWPSGPDGLDCDAEGNLWLFGYLDGDTAVLKLSPAGKLLLRIGQRERPGNDDDTSLLDRATSCYHDVEHREVFIADGYGNHRIVAFDSDTGEFTRMWGAYGKPPSSLSVGEGFGNPVHKVALGPDGHLYVCDRTKCRVQEFALAPGGAEFVREVVVASGTAGYGSTFDLAFAPDGGFMYVADGTNQRVWAVDLEDFAVVGWSYAGGDVEGEDNAPHRGLLHRFAVEPNGDLLLACTRGGCKRMTYLGVS